jgi:hypothetical protein
VWKQPPCEAARKEEKGTEGTDVGHHGERFAPSIVPGTVSDFRTEMYNCNSEKPVVLRWIVYQYMMRGDTLEISTHDTCLHSAHGGTGEIRGG